MNLKPTHFMLIVKDLLPVFKFYRDVIGLEVGWGDESAEHRYAEFKLGDINLALLKEEAMHEVFKEPGFYPVADNADKIAFVIKVDNINEAYENLKAKGVKFLQAPMTMPNWGVSVAYFRDPANNLIQINEVLVQS